MRELGGHGQQVRFGLESVLVGDELHNDGSTIRGGVAVYGIAWSCDAKSINTITINSLAFRCNKKYSNASLMGTWALILTSTVPP